MQEDVSPFNMYPNQLITGRIYDQKEPFWFTDIQFGPLRKGKNRYLPVCIVVPDP